MDEQDVKIEHNICLRCSRCANVCPRRHLILVDEQITTVDDPLRSCIHCGHCMAVCSTMSLIVDGYDPDDFVDLPDVRVNYDDFLTLLKTRRSKRHFTARSISDELWEKIIGAAVTAPVSVPPSNVEITILNGKSKVKAVLPSIVEELRKSMSDGKSDISPLVAGALQAWDEGEDYISYHSTGMMLFHADRGSDSYRENCTIAMTIAVLAAESLRLGCCIIGMISPALNRSTTAKNQLNIPETNDVIGAIILGHPILRYRREIPRQFKSVSYV